MFDRAKVKQTRTDLEAAVAVLAERLGCHIKVGSASFARDGSQCFFKVEFAAIGEGGVPETQEVTAFRRLAVAYGLEPDDFGRTFTSGGTAYAICGLKPKATRFPILAKRVGDDKIFKFPADTVRNALVV